MSPHKMRKALVIAIDGPSGAGKSTVAKLLARRLEYTYIDTGAMYRAIGWQAKQDGVDTSEEGALAGLCGRADVTITHDGDGQRVLVNGRDVSGDIRTPEMGMLASAVSRSPAVRAHLLTLQRKLGSRGGVVMDGRDIGTVVFPDADVKFFLDASAEERGRRRYVELKEKGMAVDLATITEEIRVRDRQDSTRALAPLRQAPDALYVDSSYLTIDGVVDALLAQIEKKRQGK
jgi:cytidylate kinase